MIPCYSIWCRCFLEHVLQPGENFSSEFVYNWAQSDQYLRDIQNAGFEAGLYTDQLNYNRYKRTAQKYSVNYQSPGRGLDNQLDVLIARILYKTAFVGTYLGCLSLDSGIIPGST